ncbi:GGDEF domain-containing protein [Arsukibacterium indicum]|uniref:diguanylate cyclase n=1 Tax=Arsukibacterium indicum TaxID=2848612 RepID=A0ABS6MLX8_9GAMM|nr:GGDEF domain-containing protein [Arsukibacterium indicum]MBV2129823.1 GGDEF domain-containing protein [Arsukibacterium indicum]
MLKQFVTNNHQFRPADPEYRQVYLINGMLLGMVVIFSFFFFANLAFFALYSIALLDFIGAALAVTILRRFQLSNNVRQGAHHTVLLLGAFLLAYLYFAAPDFYSLYWLCIFPPLAFFLLGRGRGLVATILFMGLLTLLMAWRSVSWPEDSFTVESLLNVIFASVCLVLLVHYYEVSRSDVFRALATQHRQLQRLSVTDTLTGMYNRSKLDDILSQEIARSIRHQSPFSVILADLDFFKSVNDNFGHMAGDQVLMSFAGIMLQHCRELDVAGRWGGEEFLIICPHTDLAGAKLLAERIRMAVANYDFPHGKQLTVSLGIASFMRDDDASTILKRADDALYRAKGKGRNRVEM